MVGPFIFLDHLGPATFAPGEGINVRPHPHIGLATVTYLFQGELLHRDSLGSKQVITPGAINWMTAGRGIVHSERTRPEEKDTLHHAHGLQSWVTLPKEYEENTAGFSSSSGKQLARMEASRCHVQTGRRISLWL
jgi:redox-sensitive bicupin YhaK (pirin superfamily)